MKRKIGILMTLLALLVVTSARADDASDAMTKAVTNYVAGVMKGLQDVADRQPTVDTFREKMKTFMDGKPEVFGASLIDTSFVIRQVYFRRDFLAVGYDLKKVHELDYFWKLMQEKPAPQLSEPGHGSLIQPRLVAMRYPIMADGKFKGIVSVMIHTDAFLKAVGLDKSSAFKIICNGTLAEEKGKLAAVHHEAKLTLPSTEWVIQWQE